MEGLKLFGPPTPGQARGRAHRRFNDVERRGVHTTTHYPPPPSVAMLAFTASVLPLVWLVYYIPPCS